MVLLPHPYGVTCAQNKSCPSLLKCSRDCKDKFNFAPLPDNSFTGSSFSALPSRCPTPPALKDNRGGGSSPWWALGMLHLGDCIVSQAGPPAWRRERCPSGGGGEVSLGHLVPGLLHKSPASFAPPLCQSCFSSLMFLCVLACVSVLFINPSQNLCWGTGTFVCLAGG